MIHARAAACVSPGRRGSSCGPEDYCHGDNLHDTSGAGGGGAVVSHYQRCNVRLLFLTTFSDKKVFEARLVDSTIPKAMVLLTSGRFITAW